VTLRRSGGGVFEIRVDDRIACSKQATGHFPTDAEIIAAVT
jgi:predicted Rdx family selenoprotein